MAAVHAASFDDAWSAADIGDLLRGPGGFGLTVRDGQDGALAAFAIARAIAGEAEVLTVAVHPAHRRRGSGRALIEAIALRAAAVGATRLLLEVASDNDAALALYRTAGFARIGERRAYYSRQGRAVDAQVLSRDLNSPPA